jgi:hypothetical protein
MGREIRKKLLGHYFIKVVNDWIKRFKERSKGEMMIGGSRMNEA